MSRLICGTISICIILYNVQYIAKIQACRISNMDSFLSSSRPSSNMDFPMNEYHDGHQNGCCLSVCTCGQLNLVIHHTISIPNHLILWISNHQLYYSNFDKHHYKDINRAKCLWHSITFYLQYLFTRRGPLNVHVNNSLKCLDLRHS